MRRVSRLGSNCPERYKPEPETKNKPCAWVINGNLGSKRLGSKLTLTACLSTLHGVVAGVIFCWVNGNLLVFMLFT